MFKTIFGVDIPKHLDELGNATGPAGLMTCSKSCTIITMKVFIEKDKITPVRVGLELLRGAIYGASALPVPEENA